MNQIPSEIVERIKPLRLLLMDVDGTLSDGRLHYSADWVESKSFDVRDGFGIWLAHTMGLHTGFVTGRNSRIVTERARELEVELVYQGRFDKDLTLDEIVQQTGYRREQIAYVGDDLFDLPIMLRVGFCAAPADAHEEVRKRAHFVSQFGGGRGAVRDVIELILKGQGLWEEALRRFITNRD